MAFNRVLMPVAFLTATAFGLATPTEAQAGNVAVKVTPVKVGVDLGPVKISGVIGGKKKAPTARHRHAVHVPAHYEWDPRLRRYVYVPAGWKTPPRAGMKWINGHWKGKGAKRQWVKGHWA